MNEDGVEEIKKSLVTIPSWSDDLLLLLREDLKKKTSEDSRKRFDLLAPPNCSSSQSDDVPEEYRRMKEEACVGSFIAMIGSIGVEFGAENASRTMWRLAEEANVTTKK